MSKGISAVASGVVVECTRALLIERPIIFEYIASLLNSAQHYSVLLTERAVVGLLRLCLIVSETVSHLS